MQSTFSNKKNQYDKKVNSGLFEWNWNSETDYRAIKKCEGAIVKKNSWKLWLKCLIINHLGMTESRKNFMKLSVNNWK